MNLFVPEKFKGKEVREVSLTKEDLLNFEERVKEEYEAATITGPVHLSKGNEEQLIEVFKYVHPDDWVFSSWRNHYHALLHGVSEEHLWNLIVSGKSMSVFSESPKLYTSSIVGGVVPIALGAAQAQKMKNSNKTPTSETWNGYKTAFPDDVFYYSYERGYPHHGTGTWVLF
jgi:TPP-dependent pyruvate/acetoin dehydrogenase alpha subunit